MSRSDDLPEVIVSPKLVELIRSWCLEQLGRPTNGALLARANAELAARLAPLGHLGWKGLTAHLVAEYECSPNVRLVFMRIAGGSIGMVRLVGDESFEEVR